MPSSSSSNNAGEPLLYHVKRTIIDLAEDKSGATRITDIEGTYSDLHAAKEAAHHALASEGYLESDFETLSEKINDEEWKQADGVLIYAKTSAGQEFEVAIDTTPNTLNLKGNKAGKIECALHYVLQTTIFYNKDRTGGIQTTEVEGTFFTRKGAYEAAQTILLDDEVNKEDFAEYDEKDNEKGEWPYGEECVVHAVGSTGENFKVLVKAALKHHDKILSETGRFVAV